MGILLFLEMLFCRHKHCINVIEENHSYSLCLKCGKSHPLTSN